MTLSSSPIICSPYETREKDFVAVAERFLHVPYLWGGKTSLGIDCSGLVQVSLEAAGIAAPRDTDLQEKAIGAPLAFDADLTGLRRGDVVFWRGHVGIMRDETTLSARQCASYAGRERASARRARTESSRKTSAADHVDQAAGIRAGTVTPTIFRAARFSAPPAR